MTEIATPQKGAAGAHVSLSQSQSDEGSSSSLLGVMASIVVVGLSMALFGLLQPMSAMAMIMAGVAGIWLLSNSSEDKPVQMSSLPASADAAASNRDAQPGGEVPKAEQVLCTYAILHFFFVIMYQLYYELFVEGTQHCDVMHHDQDSRGRQRLHQLFEGWGRSVVACALCK